VEVAASAAHSLGQFLDAGTIGIDAVVGFDDQFNGSRPVERLGLPTTSLSCLAVQRQFLGDRVHGIQQPHARAHCRGQ